MLKAHEQEFEIIISLDHINVVKGVEMFKDDLKGEVYQVMELVEGLELLEQLTKCHHYTEQDAQTIFK